jgi:DNA-binding SARP family transcriptional activator/tetratricopeptide (TPR) repeat protein
MTLSSTAPQLEILGGAMLSRVDREPWRLERKTAGVLAYLALEGATPRTMLAGLFWPESPESTARSNLRQMLRRLRDGAGAELIAGDDPLSLAPGVSVDAAQLELASFAGHDASVVAFEGELLGGYDYEDCADFTDWLLVEREHLSGLRREARSRLIDASEGAGDHRVALMHAERLLEMDPVSEITHRRVMRLHYLLGDRGAALRAFERCQIILERELGVSPMPETLALVRQIEGGERVPEPARGARRELPLSVERPPVLVGRESEWAQLESAWETGLGVAVSGEPGIGKTRLILEFVASKGAFELVEGRPGDDGVPYATLARSFRATLARHPDLKIEPWARRELARLIPVLDPHAPEPISNDADKLRFFEAMASVLETLIHRGLVALVLEDLQFADAASLEAGQYFTTRFASPDGPRLRNLLTYRTGELRPEFEALVQQSANAGQTVLIEVKRLEPQALHALVDGLGLTLPDGLASALSRHTGGNPLFALETLRSLIESGDLERGLPARLPVPGRLGSLVARRLERLTPQAQRLARTAAVAGTDFSLELAASVLETQVLDLSEVLAELEAAQVMRGTNFTHDLLTESTRAGIPAPIRSVLHGRIAEHLERNQAEPAIIARHFTDAGDTPRATAWWLRAAWSFYALGTTTRATEVFERVLDDAPTEAMRLEARYGLGLCLIGSDPDAAEAHLLTVVEQARAQGLLNTELEARGALGELYRIRGRLEDGLRQIDELLVRLPPDTTPIDRAEVYRGRFWLELRSGRLEDAEASIEVALGLAPEHALIENERALLYWHQGRFAQSARMYEILLEHLAGQEKSETFDIIAGNMAWTYWTLARNTEAVRLIERQLESASSPFDDGLARSNLATVLTSLTRYTDALEQLERARTLLGAYDLHLADVWHRIGNIHYRARRYAQALEALVQAAPLAQSVGDPYRLSYILATLGATMAKVKDLETGRSHTLQALNIARRIQFPLTTAIALQACAVVLLETDDARSALEHAREATELARACGMVEQIGASRLLEGLCGAEGAEEALRETLEIGRQHDLPHLRWQASEALGLTEDSARLLESLRHRSPAGWFAEPHQLEG